MDNVAVTQGLSKARTVCKGRADICLSVLLEPKVDRKVSGSQLGPREGKVMSSIADGWKQVAGDITESVCAGFCQLLRIMPEHPQCTRHLWEEESTWLPPIHPSRGFPYLLTSGVTRMQCTGITILAVPTPCPSDSIPPSATSFWQALGRPLFLTGKIYEYHAHIEPSYWEVSGDAMWSCHHFTFLQSLLCWCTFSAG